MKLYEHPFSGDADKHKLSALAREFASDNLHVIDLPYRLSSWALDDPDNACLWLDENEKLVGWAILQTPFWTLDYVIHPAAKDILHAEILAWADERAQAILNTPFGHPAWYAMVFEDQIRRIRDLEDAGFACQSDVGEDSWSKVLMQRSTSARVKVYQPPVGYTVRTLKGEEEAEAYVELHRSVFESTNMTADWRLRTIHHPAYLKDLDIVVQAPDCQLVAFCVGWFDDFLKAGHIEPLGCHKDYRRYALGRVALSETLRRLQSLGAETIYVETDSYRNTAFRLYEFFDFQVIKNVLVYRKVFEA
jgi:ribosomal protein S18 acetylase RimI-like enzyme